MKRRDFFKIVTGFVAGVFAAFVPKVKSKEWHFVVANYNGKGNSDGIEIYPKKLDGKRIEHFCDHTKEYCEQHKGNDGCSILRR